jgi:hypothetical protein
MRKIKTNGCSSLVLFEGTTTGVPLNICRMSLVVNMQKINLIMFEFQKLLRMFMAQNHQGGKFASPANKLQKLPFYCTSEH